MYYPPYQRPQYSTNPNYPPMPQNPPPPPPPMMGPPPPPPQNSYDTKEPPRSSRGIDFSKYENIPVSTNGKNVPKPIDSFQKSTLADLVKKNIEDAGFAAPTPVQKHSIPIVLEGRDLMACAQTGSGKTGAYLFPIITSLLKNQRSNLNRNRQCTPSVLILAPTRELCIQIFEEARKFSRGTRISCSAIYGGTGYETQKQDLRNGRDIIAATPGRLKDWLDRGQISFASIEYLVLDEADRMLDMGFEPQIREIVQKSDMPPPGKRRTLMFSATFPRPIQNLAHAFLDDFIFLTVGIVGAAAASVSQKFIHCPEAQKVAHLHQFMSENREAKTLIFVETKKRATYLEKLLVNSGFRATSIHGNKTQAQREHALKTFTYGKISVLVATNVAARGLDIDDIDCVVNFDMPSTIDEFVHRIGRTGRAGKSGRALSFTTRDDVALFGKIITILEDQKQAVPVYMKEMEDERRRGRLKLPVEGHSPLPPRFKVARKPIGVINSHDTPMQMKPIQYVPPAPNFLPSQYLAKPPMTAAHNMPSFYNNRPPPPSYPPSRSYQDDGRDKDRDRDREDHYSSRDRDHRSSSSSYGPSARNRQYESQNLYRPY